MSLVPKWTHHYHEFWSAVKLRNLWFIKLRYAAAAMLAVYYVFSQYILGIQFNRQQSSAIIIIILSIFFYNIFLHRIRKKIKPAPGGFNPLHLSVLQIALDLMALTLLLYYTGSVENPFFMFYIFHMIIGSLILPGYMVYLIAGLVVFSFSSVILLEYFGIIPHNGLSGLLLTPYYDNLNYILIFLGVFGLMMFMSVFLANKIAKELYKREQDLRESLDKIEEIEKEKQKYIIGIVHEIKTPLAAVHSFLDLVLKKYLGPVSSAVEEKLTRAKLRTGEAIRMINNVLRISRLRLMDKISNEEIAVDLLISKIMSDHKTLSDEKNLDIDFSDMRQIKPVFKGDQILLELALSNIIGNAIKYSYDEGKIIITLQSDEKQLVVEVCDNGVGIPAGELENIFSEFYRASNVREKGFEGTGLGLSLSSQIIQRHGGHIEVASPSRISVANRPGSGFTIFLPYSR